MTSLRQLTPGTEHLTNTQFFADCWHLPHTCHCHNREMIFQKERGEGREGKIKKNTHEILPPV